MINVTKTFLPPLEEYNKYLKEIWENGWITNHGKFSQELEQKLKDLLGVKHLILVNNGTIALQIALKALDIKKEVITTPFSYVATTSSISWHNSIPRFADIEEDTLTIDPNAIKQRINEQTEAILATHVFGNACNVEEIQKIAQEHNLKIIYDGAHAFGVNYKGESLLNFGDISVLSFHATKLFHTVEGGAIITNDDEVAHKLAYMRNFGHDGPENFYGIGINGKISEPHAAMGLCLMPYLKTISCERKRVTALYQHKLSFKHLRSVTFREDTTLNYAYYPIIFESEEVLLKAQASLNALQIYPRRYFYPSLSTLNYVEENETPISNSISKRILCLPLYPDLTEKELDLITSTINQVLEKEIILNPL